MNKVLCQIKYIVYLHSVFFGGFLLGTTIQQRVETLQNSLNELGNIIARTSQITPISFDESFIDSAFNAIQRQKKDKRTFRFEITKKKDKPPHWDITLLNPYKKLSGPDDFADIIHGTAEARMLFADEKYIVIFSSGYKKTVPAKHSLRNQSTVMVIPRQNVLDIAELNKEELRDILQESALIVGLFGSTDHYTFQTNRGASLQGVPHLHMHVTLYHDPKLTKPLFLQVPREKWNGKPLFFKQNK
jgi:diadenosine tetraphosphate (Ap4A) HIT family hydrolase